MCVEADAAWADGGPGFAARRRDDDDGVFAIEDRAGPGGVLAAEADVDAASEMSGGEFGGVARVENLRAGGLQSQNGIERERVQALFEGLIERGALFAVEDGVVGEVVGGFGLVGGDDLDEGVFGHGLERVVDATLFTDGGDGFFAEGFAAEGAGAVSGVDEGFIREREQFVVEGNP